MKFFAFEGIKVIDVVCLSMSDLRRGGEGVLRKW